MISLQRVRLLDLTLAQLAEVEAAVGVRMSSWGDPQVMRSDAIFQGAILAVGNGVPLEDVMSLSMSDLSGLVDTEGVGSEDPTRASMTPTQT